MLNFGNGGISRLMNKAAMCRRSSAGTSITTVSRATVALLAPSALSSFGYGTSGLIAVANAHLFRGIACSVTSLFGFHQLSFVALILRCVSAVDLRQEPDMGNLYVRIRAGGGE